MTGTAKRTFCALLLALAGAAAPAGVSFSAGNIRGVNGSGGNLGPLSSAVSPGPFWLGGYRKIGAARRTDYRIEALFIGEQLDSSSAAEEWPMVKALGQFGSFSGLQAVAPVCHAGSAPSGIPVPSESCSNPTFDLSHVRFRSRYVTLVYRDLVDRNGVCGVRRLSRFELSLFHRYGRPTARSANTLCAYAKLHGGVPAYLPLVLVGGYLQVSTFVTIPGDFEAGHIAADNSSYFTALPFGTIQRALQTGNDPTGTQLNFHVNAEANIIVALICRSDHQQPKSLCGRTAVKKILKHVK